MKSQIKTTQESVTHSSRAQMWGRAGGWVQQYLTYLEHDEFLVSPTSVMKSLHVSFLTGTLCDPSSLSHRLHHVYIKRFVCKSLGQDLMA